MIVDCEMNPYCPKGYARKKLKKTGIKCENLVIKCALVERSGVVRFNNLMDPTKENDSIEIHSAWTEKNIHHISPQEIDKAPKPSEHKQLLESLVKDRVLVGFALNNDLTVNFY